MADINKETLNNLTSLCRIDCNKEEQESLLGDLQKILTYVDTLKEIDTENVSPCNQVLAEISNVMREDEVGGLLPRDVFLANAPDQVGGLIRVPPVIKGK